ncbi:hypothetical protein E2C01_010272 [Portunus trituberculatus]|uniref:Uncharacterized protein n=1 Tax=Portunus trituberculatus TaxID=210409 RepID=A0A5B7D888_PORTR|nr:hypothetical protein [Portunus trituberculatus]
MSQAVTLLSYKETIAADIIRAQSPVIWVCHGHRRPWMLASSLHLRRSYMLVTETEKPNPRQYLEFESETKGLLPTEQHQQPVQQNKLVLQHTTEAKQQL